LSSRKRRTVNRSDFRWLASRPHDIQWGLHVTAAGQAAIPPGGAYPPPGHPELYRFAWKKGRSLPEYKLLYIAAGSGLFESALTGPRPVAAGTAVVLFPGVLHRYRPDKATGWVEYWVGFAGDVTALQDRIAAEALRLIWNGSHLQLTVAGLARQFHVTARSLERRFHASLGRTIREEIRRCRLDRVRRLLADTDLSIAEIVAVSGFSSPDALSRAVQRAEGTTTLKLLYTLRDARRQRLRSIATENPNFATARASSRLTPRACRNAGARSFQGSPRREPKGCRQAEACPTVRPFWQARGSSGRPSSGF
jgi:AraC-like DNA-binding protein